MTDPNGPSAEEMGLNKEEMKTPEQRAEEAERLREFRELSDVMLDQFYLEGKTPFGIPREEALERSSGKTFATVESEGITVDVEFLKDAQSVLEAVSAASGGHLVLGEYPLAVLEYHLALAAGTEPSTKLDIGYIKGEMEKHYETTTGQTLEDWARGYRETHPDKTIDTGANLSFIKAFEKDFEQHKFNETHLAQIFRQFAQEQGIEALTPETAIKILVEKGFIVPSEWKDEFAEIEEGKTLIAAIENVNRRLQEEEIVQALTLSLEELSAEDLQSTTLTVADVLAVASFDSGVPENWADCDEEMRRIITNVMKEIAGHFGKKATRSKGEPIIKFS